MILIYNVVNWLCNIVIYALLGRAILSWFVNPYNANPNGFLFKLYSLLTSLTEPLVRPGRSFLSRFNTGPLDLSIFLVMIVIVVLRTVILWILQLLMYGMF